MTASQAFLLAAAAVGTIAAILGLMGAFAAALNH